LARAAREPPPTACWCTWTEQAHDQLVSSGLAYVSVSRGRYDAQIYTNDAEKLGQELSRDVSRKGHGQNGVDGVYGLFFLLWVLGGRGGIIIVRNHDG
jgi:hypothetical protein